MIDIRRVEETDLPLIAEWINYDPDHSAKMSAEFFQQPETLSLAFHDELGVVFFVRLDPQKDRTVRVHIQFQPGQALRTVRALRSGFLVVKDRCRMAHAKKIIFDSMNHSLIEFCVNRFGFARIEGTNDLELEIEGVA